MFITKKIIIVVTYQLILIWRVNLIAIMDHVKYFFFFIINFTTIIVGA